MRRRLALLVVVIAIVVGARLIAHRPVDVDLSLRLGADAARVRAVDLLFSDADERVARDLHLAFPTGARPDEPRRVRLRDGRYTVDARLTFDGLPERRVSRPLAVDESGVHVLDLE
jgi:hypothetical protein